MIESITANKFYIIPADAVMVPEYKSGAVPPSDEEKRGADMEDFYSIFNEVPKAVPSTIRKTRNDESVYLEY
ncbi:MAG: hypothetical protein ACP5E4_00485 [Candidatus Aenigmatarchaeota archaeon]